MWYFTWWVVGMILLTITIWINKHTVTKECSWRDWDNTEVNPIKLPVWAYILMFIVACIPGLNLFVFYLGTISYIMACVEGHARFVCDAKWYKLLMKKI